jgi:hypothetical protein
MNLDPLMAADFGDAGAPLTVEEAEALIEAPVVTWASEPQLLQSLLPASGCTVAIPAPPEGVVVDPGGLMVIVWPDGGDPIHLLRTLDPECEQGWLLEDATNEVRLCPTSCLLLRTDPGGGVQFVFHNSGSYVPPD